MAKEIQKMEGTAITSEKQLRPVEVIESTLMKKKSDFIKVLPSHISFEKFQRTVMTAITQNPDLILADRTSLMLSCIKSASDGLLPDGRDAALVIFNVKGKDASGKEVWMKKAQYLPMYAGIIKKVRQSGDIASVVSHVVYERDKFEYVLGDEERVLHEPYMGAEARGKIIAAYAIARLKDGTTVREVMTFQDIEKVRKTSKSGSDKDTGEAKGIWRDWYEEMARKTVFRRLAKWLPQSIELVDQAFSNDDSMDTFTKIQPSAPVPMIEDQKDDGASAEFIEDGTEDTALNKEKQPNLKKDIKDKKDKKEKPPASEANPEEKTVSDFDRIREEMMRAKDQAELTAIWLDGGDDAGTNSTSLKGMSVAEWNKLRDLHDECAASFGEE